jgi:hypothetical protein
MKQRQSHKPTRPKRGPQLTGRAARAATEAQRAERASRYLDRILRAMLPWENENAKVAR